jgi:hypothetical protein
MAAMCVEAGIKTLPCEYNDSNKLPIESKIHLAIDALNLVHYNSLTGVRFNLVHSYLAEDYEVKKVPLDVLRIDGDGILDHVHVNRDLYGADLVTLVGNWGSAVGFINSVASSAFTYVSRGYLGGRGLIHEIGHNFGCNHDRDHSGKTTEGYAFGYQDNINGFRTIMSYPCKVGKCPTVKPYYSTPLVLVDGLPIGTSTEDCARKIKDRREIVANFRDSITAQPTASPTESKLSCGDDELAFELYMHIPSSINISLKSWSLSYMNYASKSLVDGKWNAKDVTDISYKACIPANRCYEANMIFNDISSTNNEWNQPFKIEILINGKMLRDTESIDQVKITDNFGSCYQIRSEYPDPKSSLCMDPITQPSDVTLQACKYNSKKQKWYIDDVNQIHSLYDPKLCLKTKSLNKKLNRVTIGSCGYKPYTNFQYIPKSRNLAWSYSNNKMVLSIPEGGNMIGNFIILENRDWTTRRQKWRLKPYQV